MDGPLGGVQAAAGALAAQGVGYVVHAVGPPHGPHARHRRMARPAGLVRVFSMNGPVSRFCDPFRSKRVFFSTGMNVPTPEFKLRVFTVTISFMSAHLFPDLVAARNYVGISQPFKKRRGHYHSGAPAWGRCPQLE